jgi:hypothetical protein
MERLQFAILLFVCFVAVSSLSAPQKLKMTVLSQTNPYKLEAKGEQFIQDLINNMTLKAKIGQMTQVRMISKFCINLKTIYRIAGHIDISRCGHKQWSKTR